ncbi:hypothetical protein E3N88_06157 [Mikania micrantha]|uniref:Uncharacterized protein n=1 Tax=Mikania micrantha TaxID=192012 RepID=A0A5N6PNP2_9ASTR|nr:hypothetical protein E3N88_06157 [Mikania micrantha]
MPSNDLFKPKYNQSEIRNATPQRRVISYTALSLVLPASFLIELIIVLPVVSHVLGRGVMIEFNIRLSIHDKTTTTGTTDSATIAAKSTDSTTATKAPIFHHRKCQHHNHSTPMTHKGTFNLLESDDMTEDQPITEVTNQDDHQQEVTEISMHATGKSRVSTMKVYDWAFLAWYTQGLATLNTIQARWKEMPKTLAHQGIFEEDQTTSEWLIAGCNCPLKEANWKDTDLHFPTEAMFQWVYDTGQQVQPPSFPFRLEDKSCLQEGSIDTNRTRFKVRVRADPGTAEWRERLDVAWREFIQNLKKWGSVPKM